ncbi:MAG: hypothetical protein MRJ65_02060 [Candidatus Brocadiaceae bacterium]|nr:hypothetical protein [Candidatus Brocadiaceae bacterium]
MRKTYKSAAYTQIIVLACLTLFNGGTMGNASSNANIFPCEGHHCGCNSVSDCIKNCCCATDENQNSFQQHGKGKKQGLQSFIGSLTCNTGNNTVFTIFFPCKYVVEEHSHLQELSFLCFAFNNNALFISKIIASPPKIPPRLLA